MKKTPFGRRLTILREERNLTQEEFAARLGWAGYGQISQQVISKWESKPTYRIYPGAFEATRRALRLSDEESKELAILWAYNGAL